MTAVEARKNAQHLSSDIIARCDKLIERKSLQGEMSCDFVLEDQGSPLSYLHKINLLHYLKDNGFDVSIHKCLDSNYAFTGFERLWICWNLKI